MAKKIDLTVLTNKALIARVAALNLTRYSDWAKEDWNSYNEALRRGNQRQVAKAAGVKVNGYRGKRRLLPVTAEPTKKAA